MLAGQSVLITGGAGFIGARLAMTLSDRHRVTVFDNFNPQVHDAVPQTRMRLARHGVDVITGDIRDRREVGAAVARTRPRVIYHLAAETGTGQSYSKPTHYTDVNVMGTAHLIEAVRRHVPDLPRIILAGSRSVYGEGSCLDAQGRPACAMDRRQPDLDAGLFQPRSRTGALLTPVPTDATCPVAPASVYASTKLMQEYLLSQAFWGTPTRVGILRLQNVYGPGQSMNNPYTGVLSIFCRQILDGQVLDIFEDGQITRDFVQVDDVVRAFAMMGQARAMPQEVLDIGVGQGATILSVAQTLLACLGAPPDRLVVTGAYRPGDIRHAVADISRAVTLLGWRPDVALPDGLARLAAWSRDQVSYPAKAIS
jgi:dTDP-L-rhamnose 4-epimerase